METNFVIFCIHVLWVACFTDANTQTETQTEYMNGEVRGDEIAIEEAPYLVQYGHGCAGSIIHPLWILTAAHCTHIYDHVLAGSSEHYGGDRYRIVRHIMHPQWSKTNKMHSLDWDYQLLLLEKPIPITGKSRPIPLGTEHDILPGHMLEVAGWGMTQTDLDTDANLGRVQVPIISHSECEHITNGTLYEDITDRMFCAGYPKGAIDACQGDSGGGAVSNGKLVGVVSFGMGCAEAFHPGIYSNVPRARKWIQEVTGLNQL